MALLPRAVLLLAVIVAATLGIQACESPVAPTPDCTLTIAPTTRTFASDGGSGSLTVSASDASCVWTATSGAAWVAITGGASGTGSGSVQYSVAVNASAAARIASILVGAASHVITQEGQQAPECAYALQPASASIGSEGGTGTFAIVTTDLCAWTVTSQVPWLTIESPASGTGAATVTYRAQANPDDRERIGAIDAAGRVFGLTQEAAPTIACEYTVAPVTFSPCMPAGTITTRLIASADSCSWTVATDVPWLTLRTAPSGRGSADIVADFGANYDPPRLGQLLVRWPTITAGQNVRIAQAGCFYAVTQSSFSIGADGGSTSFDVVQMSDPYECGGPLQNGCVWTAVSDVPWIVIISSMPRSGDDRVSFTVSPNPDAAGRVGTITVKDKRVTVTQAAR